MDCNFLASLPRVPSLTDIGQGRGAVRVLRLSGPSFKVDLELYRLIDILAKVAALGPEVGGDRVLSRLVVSQQVLGVALTRRLVDLRTEDFPWRTQVLLRTPLREEGGFREDARARQSGPSHRSASTGAA